jgi:hypothetical protein
MIPNVELLLSGWRQRRALLRAVILSVTALLFGVIAGCSSGGSSPATTTAAPANLAYPQAAITATAGQSISADTPTVKGTVTTYSVAPALPAGLSLNTATGAITGTPTAVASQGSYVITASNSSGTTTATVQITVSAAVVAPASLVYPQTTISATVAQAITTDTPTVTGTVTSYSVSPTLPAGLAISTTTGAISGTPTAVAAQATYTITATNSAGSATATVKILVNAAVPPPSQLVYPQPNIVASVGQAIPADIPSVTGTATSFTVSPTLPAGFSLSATTGAITGIGTATSPQTNYTVTASNAGGSTTGTVSILVNPALTTLLDLGHASQITQLRLSATRVLSKDDSNHWALWDYASYAELASGDQLLPAPSRSINPITSWPVDMANQVFAIGQTNGVDVRAVSDGHLLFEIQSPQIDSATIKSWWKLATDGSYICSGSPSGLTVWSSTGQQLFTRQGDYSSASPYAAPGQILVALGPAGQNVIENISISNGTSSTEPAFSGTFNSWFLDGQRFLTNTGTTVWVYDAAVSTNPAPVSLPAVEKLTGQGNWFWAYSPPANQYQGAILTIYPVGGSVPSATIPIGATTTPVPSGNTIGLLSGGPSDSVVDLSGATPITLQYTLPPHANPPSVYAAVSASQWVGGNTYGVVLDGASSSTTPRYFNTGAVLSMAGSANLVAIATANSNISYYSPSATATSPVGTINFSSSKIALSADGTVLVAMANPNVYYSYQPGPINFYSLPSGNLTRSDEAFYGLPTFDFSLSASGTVFGTVWENALHSSLAYFTRSVGSIGGSPAYTWQDNPPDQNDGINLSPDGTLIAVSSGPKTNTSTTNIYKNGVLATAVNGFPIGWIDNNQLLVNNYGQQVSISTYAYTGASIYSATGSLVSTPTLPELLTIQPVDSTSIYSPTRNTIFSLPSGNVLYQSGTPVTGPAAVAGPSVVFTSGTRIVVDTH